MRDISLWMLLALTCYLTSAAAAVAAAAAAAEAAKPEDWDDDEDGEWEAPRIANPKCKEAPGCGEWKRPTKTVSRAVCEQRSRLLSAGAHRGLVGPAAAAAAAAGRAAPAYATSPAHPRPFPRLPPPRPLPPPSASLCRTPRTRASGRPP